MPAYHNLMVLTRETCMDKNLNLDRLKVADVGSKWPNFGTKFDRSVPIFERRYFGIWTGQGGFKDSYAV